LRAWLKSEFEKLSPRTRHLTYYVACGVACVGVIAFDIQLAAGPAAPRHGRLELAPAIVVAIPPNQVLEELVTDSLRGVSGKLRARFVAGPLSQSYPALDPTVGARPGVSAVSLSDGSGNDVFSFVSLVPFRQKFGDRVGSYLVGYWPGELRRVSTDGYENPVGFIEVNQSNELTRLSEHFVLRDFITKDKQHSWPKYVVLQEPLIDKMELVISDLQKRGVPVQNVRVLSGFRTPYHNLYGIGSEGGARDSRHQFGDGADIIIDNDRDGRMDDLNRDRRVDSRDLDMILQAVERVEAAHPEMVGGLGKYHAIGPSGPFAHIDVRGYRARWSNDARAVAAVVRSAVPAGEAQRAGEAVKIGKCNASAQFAALCGSHP
jgi:hypothetical protein